MTIDMSLPLLTILTINDRFEIYVNQNIVSKCVVYFMFLFLCIVLHNN